MEKGAFPRDAFKHNNTKAPKVYTAVVVSVLEHLRSLGVVGGGGGGGRGGGKGSIIIIMYM